MLLSSGFLQNWLANWSQVCIDLQICRSKKSTYCFVEALQGALEASKFLREAESPRHTEEPSLHLADWRSEFSPDCRLENDKRQTAWKGATVETCDECHHQSVRKTSV
ncbi:unnamed protein product [Polarella glacialis]|uniref:Uncharacterized protein n=1 Tax=Polarella glacialis TaxID=89957 RepID=A0A813LRQ6_POLGL|nr:unnamed protein product [Polarella glacialis]